jgi:hypothetical protein
MYQRMMAMTGGPRNLSPSAKVFNPQRLVPKQSYLIKKVEGLESAVNPIEDPEELQGLFAKMNKMLESNAMDTPKKRAGPSLEKLTVNGFKKNRKYSMQYYVKGQPTFMYWNQGGLCYFIDMNNQALELENKAYRNSAIGDALIEGILTTNIHNEIVFVVNDICHFKNKSIRNLDLLKRSQELQKLMGSIATVDGPIKIVYNPPVPITAEEFEKNMIIAKLNDVRVPANGFVFAPNFVKFHFTKKQPAYKWLCGSDGHVDKQVLINFLNK